MTAPERKRKRRTRSPHPGVVLLPPDETHVTWRARYRDPDTGKMVKQRLDPEGVRDAQARRDWAILKSRAIAKRDMLLAAGAPRATGKTVEQGVEAYFAAHPELREKTLLGYRAAARRLLDWAERDGVESVDEITRGRLLELRAHLAQAPRTKPAPGAKRGQRVARGKRNPVTVNSEMRRVHTILRYLLDAEWLAKANGDDLRRAFKPVPVAHERLDFLKRHQLQRLIEAALRHDRDTFAVTRDRVNEAKPRHEAIAPFVAVTLLTGCRLAEAQGLEWRHVDLEAVDAAGNVVGEIHLPGATNKTRRARTLDLSVSPALRRLLAALRRRDGSKGPVFRERAPDEHGKPVQYSRHLIEAARRRLVGDPERLVKRERPGTPEADGRERERSYEARPEGYGAPPEFTWQGLRRTCGTFLTCAPGLFGAASAYRSARQLGHSVTVSERHYAGLMRGIPADVRDLETAMQIGALLERVIAAVEGKGDAPDNVVQLGGRR